MHNSVRRRWPSLILGLLLTAGALALWISAWLFGTVAWEAADRPRRWERLEVRDNAAVLVQQYDQVNRKANVTYRGLAGLPQSELKGKTAHSVSLQADTQGEDLEIDSWFDRIRGFNDGQNPTNHWYLIHDGRPNGTAYFVGYSSLSKQIIGYLGTQGYRPDLPPATERFAVDPQLLATGNALAGRAPSIGYAPNDGWGTAPLYLLANGSVYQVDFDNRVVTLLKRDERVISIGTIVEDETVEVEGDPVFIQRQRSIFRTESALVFPELASEAFEPRQSITIPAELRKDNLIFYACRGPENILQTDHLGDPLQPELFWIDSAGTINRRADVKLLGHRKPTGGATHWWTATLLPSTALMLLAEFIYFPLEVSVENQSLDYATKLRNALAVGWPPLLVVAVLCAAMSAWVYRRQRQFAAPGAALWAILVFLFGPFGLAGYWLHRSWPARQRCPSCGQMVPHDRERCAACAVQFPAPARLGIEIFA